MMQARDRFRGKTALVTGAGRGIGLAMVKALAAEGAEIIAVDRDPGGCANVACANGAAILTIACDLADPQAVKSMAHDALAHTGALDAVFCNAGIVSPEAPTEDEVTQVFAVNLHHPRLLAEVVAPHMAARSAGAIIMTSSLAGLRGNRSLGVYALTKAALAQLARDLAVKWAPHNVRVNAISPGLIATGWQKNILGNPEAAARRLAATPLRRVGEPREIASAALFLGSDDASFITGHNLVVDGGTLISDGN